jgi:hypothetical protein
MVSAETTVAAAAGQFSCNLADEAVVLSLDAGLYYGFNPVAARVWSLIQRARTVREIRDVLVSEYDVEPERCEQDLVALLNDLIGKRLVTARDGTPP